jgi:PiT family inorganic phosphate transporter
MDYSFLLIAVIALALIFDFINGFHDAANSIATIVSTKVLTPFQAVVWAAMFNFLAFFIFKDHAVANTIAKTVDVKYTMEVSALPLIAAGLLSAIIWSLLTWFYGIPSSSSHTLIGGFGGAFLAAYGIDAINIGIIIATAIFIVVAPIAGMLMSYLISVWLLNAFRKELYMKLITLSIIFGACYLVGNALETDMTKVNAAGSIGVAWLDIALYGGNFKWILLGFLVVSLGICALFLSTLNNSGSNRLFKKLQLVSSAAFSIGHGGNDAQKVMGIISVALLASNKIGDIHEMPDWVPISCYTAIALGTLSGGWKIVKTMGNKITKVNPFEGVAAESAGAITLFFTEGMKFPWKLAGDSIHGIPVSTTHTITGSIIGVGITKRISAVKWGVTGKLLVAWIITIPISAGLGALFYYIMHFCGVNA